jgi:hypothetical protein
MARKDDLEYGLQAREQEQRIKQNEKRLKGGTHGAKRTHLKRSILQARHSLGH